MRYATGLAGPSPSGRTTWTAKEIRELPQMRKVDGTSYSTRQIQRNINNHCKNFKTQKEQEHVVDVVEYDLIEKAKQRLLIEFQSRDLGMLNTKDIPKMVEQFARAEQNKAEEMLAKDAHLTTKGILEAMKIESMKKAEVIDVQATPIEKTGEQHEN